MAFRLVFTQEAAAVLADLQSRGHHRTKLKKVRNALGRLEQDPSYPGLRSHKYHSISGSRGEDVFDSYVENRTASAWRTFWHYGPGADLITIVTIGPHPD